MRAAFPDHKIPFDTFTDWKVDAIRSREQEDPRLKRERAEQLQQLAQWRQQSEAEALLKGERELQRRVEERQRRVEERQRRWTATDAEHRIRRQAEQLTARLSSE